MEKISTVIEYYMELPKHLHFVRITTVAATECFLITEQAASEF